MKKILLVEDDPTIREPLSEQLTKHGFQVETADCLKMASQVNLSSIDLIVMDWELPDGEGVDFVKALREKSNLTPVIFLTARTDVIDKVIGFEIGANDFMTKPFELRELVARIRNQLRYPAQQTSNEIVCGDIRVDLDSYRAFYKEQEVSLSKTEFNLLVLFMQNENKALGRDEILNKVWGYENFPVSRTVDVHVNNLRKKFNPDYFEGLRGIGYRFNTQ